MIALVTLYVLQMTTSLREKRKTENEEAWLCITGLPYL